MRFMEGGDKPLILWKCWAPALPATPGDVSGPHPPAPTRDPPGSCGWPSLAKALGRFFVFVFFWFWAFFGGVAVAYDVIIL